MMRKVGRTLQVGDWDLRGDKISSAAGKRRHGADAPSAWCVRATRDDGVRGCRSQEPACRGKRARSRRCGLLARYQRWEKGTGEIHSVRPRAIRGLRPAGSESLEATLEVVSEDFHPWDPFCLRSNF